MRVGRTCRTKPKISMPAILASERINQQEFTCHLFNLAPSMGPAYPVTVASWTDSLFGRTYEAHKNTFTWPVNDRACLAPGAYKIRLHFDAWEYSKGCTPKPIVTRPARNRLTIGIPI